jgi:hypothetical protein
MKLSTLMVIKAIVCLAFAVLLLAIPAQLMSIYGVELDAGGAFMARLYGSSLAGNLLLTWLSRGSRDSEALRAAIAGLFLYDAIGLVVSVAAMLSGLMNPLGWSVVAIYLFLTVGYGYFHFIQTPEA